VRVLIAKDAISTGWDCPRAEVMVSFRAATDKTHITQLLGRMVRTPLARRIPGNERLNAVDCLLPFFNKKTVEAVADALMKGVTEGEGDIPGRRVLINPREMKPNPDVSEEVWDKLLSLPSQSLPQRVAKPVRRLTALAHELAWDKLLPNAGKAAHAEMHRALDDAAAQYSTKIAEARKSVLTVDGASLRADLVGKKKSFDQFLEDADYTVIEDAYRRAGREFSPDVTKTYAEYLAAKATGVDAEEALIDAHTDIAAMALVQEVRGHLDAEAEKLTSAWFDKYRSEIKALSDQRQEEYRQIRGMSADPQDIDVAKPGTWLEATAVKEPGGAEVELPTFKNHLMSDANGDYPLASDSSWEPDVLAKEINRADAIAWYRNPARATQESLGLVYELDGLKICRPDFIFFAQESGNIVADLIDPHGHHLADALPKIRGLVSYAKAHPGHFRRVEAVTKVGDDLRYLDLLDAETQDAAMKADSAIELYKGSVGRPY
jgi:hypothetical protein